MSAFNPNRTNSSVQRNVNAQQAKIQGTVCTKNIKFINDQSSSYTLNVNESGKLVLTNNISGDSQESLKTLERIVVANRDANSFNLIDESMEETKQVKLLPSGGPASPMYVSAPTKRNEVIFGDRTNDQIIVSSLYDFRIRGTASTSAGPFHSFWSDSLGQIWITCDTAKRITVVDIDTLEVLADFAIPGDLTASYKPHDVTLGSGAAFVTMIEDGVVTGDSVLVRYETVGFTETGRVTLAPDSHVYYSNVDSKLYSAAQGNAASSPFDSAIYRIDPTVTTPVIEASIVGDSVAGAHGIWGDNDRLYIADITQTPGHIYVVKISDFTIQQTFTTASFGGIHNLMLNSDSSKIFVTRTGPGDVLVFDVNNDGNVVGSGRTIYSAAAPMGLMRVEKIPSV